MCRCTSSGTLVSRTCARAVAAPCGKACRVTAKVLRGSFGAIQEQSIQAKETRPRQEELAWKATQGTRPRQEELAGKANQGISRNLPRRATRPGKARRATSFRTRQDNDRGKALAAASNHSVPTLQRIHQRVALGPFQAYVARGCAARGTLWQAALTRSPSWRAVASLTIPFLHCLGDVDRHLMPLSPAVRVRYDTLCR